MARAVCGTRVCTYRNQQTKARLPVQFVPGVRVPVFDLAPGAHVQLARLHPLAQASAQPEG
eukprot:1721147-Rhodomonas_salina.1